MALFLGWTRLNGHWFAGRYAQRNQTNSYELMRKAYDLTGVTNIFGHLRKAEKSHSAQELLVKKRNPPAERFQVRIYGHLPVPLTVARPKMSPEPF